MAPPLLILQDIQLSFGGPPLLEGAALSIGPGERLCLVGRNGSGKSTLLKIAAGTVQPDAGSRFLQPGTTIRYLTQEPDLGRHKTVGDYVTSGLDPDQTNGGADRLIAALGLAASLAAETLSGGEARRAALAHALAASPDILLMDEPTNHLDLPTIAWLEERLKSSRAALVLISHDRRFLSTLSRATLWLDRGRTRLLEAGFESFETWRDGLLEQEELDRHKLSRRIAREEDWLRYGVTARRKRNQRRLGALHDLRRKRSELRAPTGNASLSADAAPQSGRVVIDAKDTAKAYGDRDIVSAFSTRILRGDRVALVGANGAGKTTLLNILTGALPPDRGSVRIAETVRMQSLDQRRETLNADWSLAEALTDRGGDTVTVNGKSRHVIGYMKDFLFTPEQAGTPVARLSGGERARLMLARALARPSNLLVLDEPTNDLDLETLDLLQELLTDYDGTVLLVSHDRDFLDRVATSVIVPEGAGHWRDYAGGYSDMLRQRGRDVDGTLGRTGDAPARGRKQTKTRAPAPAQRLGFKERKALETLPSQIDGLRATISKMERLLADPDFFKRDPGGAQEAVRALQATREALEKAEERWLELEILREEAEGSV